MTNFLLGLTLGWDRWAQVDRLAVLSQSLAIRLDRPRS